MSDPARLVSNKCLKAALCALLVSACGDSPRDAHSPSDASSGSLPGVYAGTFPCADCDGIPATLWLRPEGLFFFKQSYPAEEGATPTDAYNLGRWRWSREDELLVLDGAGPPRLFAWPDLDSLEMMVPSDLEHVLVRSAAAPEFTDRIRLEGMTAVRAGKASFTECLTGLITDLAKQGDYPRFLRHYGKLAPRGGTVLAELEGHFVWSAEGELKSLVIDRFVTVKPDGAC